jgi:hypothetical protein
MSFIVRPSMVLRSRADTARFLAIIKKRAARHFSGKPLAEKEIMGISGLGLERAFCLRIRHHLGSAHLLC